MGRLDARQRTRRAGLDLCFDRSLESAGHGGIGQRATSIEKSFLPARERRQLVGSVVMPVDDRVALTAGAIK
jgi:hypothetical protein